MLLGVALIVEDMNKGQKCAFRYPGPIPSTPTSGSSSFEKERSGDETFRTQGEEEVARLKAAATSNDSASYNDFWRFDPTLFARLLRPSPPLCGKRFELTIDNFHFIGHPVQVTNTQSITLFNLVFIVDAESGEAADGDGGGPEYSPGSNLYGVPQLGSNASLFMYHETVAKLTAALAHEQSRNGYVSREAVAMIRAADGHAEEMIMSESEEGSSSSTPKAHDPSSHASASKKGESNGEVDGSEEQATPLVGEGLVHAAPKEKDWRTSAELAIESILAASKLARDLKSIFLSLRATNTVDISFQGLVDVSLTLQHPGFHPTAPIRPYQTLLLYNEVVPVSTDEGTPLFKMVAYLSEMGPLQSFKDISIAIDEPLAEVFCMAAHLAYWGKGRIIDALSKHNIYRIDPDAELTTAELDSKFESLLSRFMDKSDARRKFVTLPRILGLLSKASNSGLPRMLSEHMESAKKVLTLESFEFVEILVWLLQQDLLIQLHQYILLIVPNRVRQMPKVVRAGDVHAVQEPELHRSLSSTSLPRAEDENLSMKAQTSKLNSAVIQQHEEVAVGGEAGVGNATLSQAQKNELAHFQRVASDTKTYHLLKALHPYFHGKHHMEEIMWRNNISRDTLNTVIQTYADVLIPFLR